MLFCNNLVKKWRYAFQVAKKMLAWHIGSYRPTSSTADRWTTPVYNQPNRSTQPSIPPK